MSESSAEVQVKKKSEKERFLEGYTPVASHALRYTEEQLHDYVHDFISDYDMRQSQQYHSVRRSYEEVAYRVVPDVKTELADVKEPEMGYKARRNKKKAKEKSKKLAKEHNKDANRYSDYSDYTAYILQCDREHFVERKGKDENDIYPTDEARQALWDEIMSKKYSPAMFDEKYFGENYEFIQKEMDKLNDFINLVDDNAYGELDAMSEGRVDMIRTIYDKMTYCFGLALEVHHLRRDYGMDHDVDEKDGSTDLSKTRLESAQADLADYLEHYDKSLSEMFEKSIDEDMNLIYKVQKQEAYGKNHDRNKRYNDEGISGDFLDENRYRTQKRLLDLLDDPEYAKNVEDFRAPVDKMLRAILNGQRMGDDLERKVAAYSKALDEFFEKNGKDVRGYDTYQGDARLYYTVLKKKLAETENTRRMYDAYTAMLDDTVSTLMRKGKEAFRDVEYLTDAQVAVLKRYQVDIEQISKKVGEDSAKYYADTAEKGLLIYTDAIKRRYEREPADSRLKKMFPTVDDMIQRMTMGTAEKDALCMKEGDEAHNDNIVSIRIDYLLMKDADIRAQDPDATPEQKSEAEKQRKGYLSEIAEKVQPMFEQKYKKIIDFCDQNAGKLYDASDSELAGMLPEITELMGDVSLIQEMCRLETEPDYDLQAAFMHCPTESLRQESYSQYKEEMSRYEADKIMFRAKKDFLFALWEKARFAAVTHKGAQSMTDPTAVLTTAERSRLLREGDDPKEMVRKFAIGKVQVADQAMAYNYSGGQKKFVARYGEDEWINTDDYTMVELLRGNAVLKF